MSFSDCITAYANSERIVKWGAVGHPVAFPELAAFDEARRRLVHKIQDNAMHESWDDGLKLFNTIHAKLARTPCRPDWLIREILDTRGGRRAIEGMEGRLSNVDPGVRDAFSDLKERLDVLGSVETSPLLEPLKDSRMSNGTTLFVLRDLRILEEVRICLAEVLTCQKWEIVKPSSLRAQRHADRLCIFGPVWCLSYRNEEYLLRAPAAGEVHIVACAHEFSGDVRISLFGENDKIKVTGTRRAQPNEKPWDFEPIAPAQRGRFRFKGSGESRIWESGKKVPAIPFRFGGARGTYFAKDSSVWVVTADCSGFTPICTGVDKIPVDELEPGGLVLMTTSGGGDMIPVVADMILPRSRQIRSLQIMWKSALRDQVEQNGLHHVASHLKSLGAHKASATNLKNWCNPRSLGMENLETDLSAVLKLIGMDTRYDDVVAGIAALRSSHQSAGVQLQKKLRESLQGKDLSEVFRQGQLEIRHRDGPAKTVFLVEERGEEEEIPEEWEGELRDIDE